MENFMVDDAKGRNKGKRKLLRADDGRHSPLSTRGSGSFIPPSVVAGIQVGPSSNGMKPAR